MLLFGPNDGFHWILLAGGCLAVLAVASARRSLQRTFAQFGGVRSDCGLTGAQAARQLLAAVELSHVAVVRSNRLDCYEPRKGQVQLRDQTFDSSSLAALAIAAHEVGHAQQFATGFWPARLRLWLRPIFLTLLSAIVGMFALTFALLPADRFGFALFGLFGTCGVMVLLQIPTVLPLEYDASRRAKALVVKAGLLAPYEESSFVRLLNAASRTYLASESQRWLLLLAVGAAIFWLTPGSLADSRDFAFTSQSEAGETADDEPSPSDWQYDRNIELPHLLLSSLATLIPAAALLFVIGKLPKTSRRRPSNIETAVSRNNAGLELLRRGDLAAALDAFSSALTLDPKLPAAYLNRGHCHLRQGRFDDALADVETSLRLNPSAVDALTIRAQIWTHQGRYDRASADLQRALEMSPKNSAALTCRGNLFLAQREFDKALADFEQALGHSPGNGAAYLGRATIAVLRGDIDAALADCSQAVASSGDAGSAYTMRGRIWLQKREHDRAIADFTSALKLDPQSAARYSLRGLAYYLKGVHDLAIADQKKAIELDPTDAVAYNNRGAAYLKLHQYAAAAADLQKALELKPEFPNPHKHLAWLKATCPLADFRDGRAAVAHAQSAQHLADENPAEHQALLAAAYAECGDFARAVECQSRCLELTPPQAAAPARERLTLYEAHQPFRQLP